MVRTVDCSRSRPLSRPRAAGDFVHRSVPDLGTTWLALGRTSTLAVEEAVEPEVCEEMCAKPLAGLAFEDIELPHVLPQGKAGWLGDEGPSGRNWFAQERPQAPGDEAAGTGVEERSIGSITSTDQPVGQRPRPESCHRRALVAHTYEGPSPISEPRDPGRSPGSRRARRSRSAGSDPAKPGLSGASRDLTTQLRGLHASSVVLRALDCPSRPAAVKSSLRRFALLTATTRDSRSRLSGARRECGRSILGPADLWIDPWVTNDRFLGRKRAVSDQSAPLSAPTRRTATRTEPPEASYTGQAEICGEGAVGWGGRRAVLGRTRRNPKYVKKSSCNPLRGRRSRT